MIINTRPVDLGKQTNLLLGQSNCNFMHLPLTKIINKVPSSESLKYLQNIESYDAVIFTSQSAVKHGAKYLQEVLHDQSISVISVGVATQKSLMKLKISSIVPSSYNSEGLAALIQQNNYQKCLVICGEKKPRLIKLTQATINTFSCYESVIEESTDILEIPNNQRIIMLIFTLQSLKIALRKLSKDQIANLVLIVASNRIREVAIECDFKKCVVAIEPHDEEMIRAALLEY